MKAVDFYNEIQDLIETSKFGVMSLGMFGMASVQVGSISTILEHDKDSLAIIESLSNKKNLPEDFFEKPLYFPFTNTQLAMLKSQCWVKDGEGRIIEEKLINLYEKILEKQKENMKEILPNLIENFNSTLRLRNEILLDVRIKLNDKIAALAGRQEKLGFFDTLENLTDKINPLVVLLDKITKVSSENTSMMSRNHHIEDEPFENVVDYLKNSEENIHSAFKEAEEKLSIKSKHSNPLMKFLNELIYFITLGFGNRMVTNTESVVHDASLSLGNKF